MSSGFLGLDEWPPVHDAMAKANMRLFGFGLLATTTTAPVPSELGPVPAAGRDPVTHGSDGTRRAGVRVLLLQKAH